MPYFNVYVILVEIAMCTKDELKRDHGTPERLTSNMDDHILQGAPIKKTIL